MCRTTRNRILLEAVITKTWSKEKGFLKKQLSICFASLSGKIGMFQDSQFGNIFSFTVTLEDREKDRKVIPALLGPIVLKNGG